ncbi:DUF2884 domain-containing protein [Hafnia paralvei]|uniref:DUF2884 domain-containing protein n=1 Tax=Hafnia paralvei TaxID=546367 RepID=UPI00267163F4|nr:DUF2884 domain-containing protein [Hafnia paralvei]
MIRKLGLSLLMLTAWQAQAAWECNVKPQDDIIVNPQQVQIVGASGNLTIDKNGNMTRDGKAVTLSTKAQQQAVNLQSGIRKDFPWIDEGAQTRLEKARVSLDKVIVEQVGSDSNIRNRLTKLDSQLKEQMQRILEKRSDGYTFHHQAISKVEQEGQNLVNQTMGGVLQDSINEMGLKQAANATSDNPLQAIMGNLGGLQQAIRSEWSKQEDDFKSFGKDVCSRITTLDSQRQALLKELPKA